MKMPGFDLDGIKKFAVNHFEKGLFGLIVLFGVMVLYGTFSVEKFPSDKVPPKLVSEVSSAESTIKQETWPEVQPKYQEMINDKVYDEVRANLNNKLDAASYNKNMDVLTEGERLLLTPRFDPVLLVVEQLEWTGVRDSMVRSVSRRSKITQLDTGKLRKAASDDKKKKRTKKKSRPKFDPDMDPSMMDPSMMDPSMMDEPEVVQPPPSSDLLPESIANEMVGVRVTGGQGKQLVGGYFVSVTGVVPFKQQLIEFRKLSNALGFDPEADYPVYTKVEIERMDMAAPEASRQWIDITASLESLAKNVAVHPPEVCAPEFVDPAIALKSLPLLRTDPAKFGVHSMLPEYPWIEPEAETEEIEEEPVFDPITGLEIVKRKTTSGMDPNETPEAISTVPIGIRRVEVDEAAEFKLVRFSDYVQTGKQYRYRVRLLLVDPNLPVSIVNGAPMDDGDTAREDTGTYDSETRGAKVEHGNSGINETMLASKVRDRLQALKASERFQSLDENIRFSVPTPWSEPSGVVSATPPASDFFAGKATPAEVRRAENVNFRERGGKAQLVMTKWSNAYSYRLPIFANVYRGSPMSVKQVIKLIDPFDLSIREIRGDEIEGDGKGDDKKYTGIEISSDAIVLDITGGDDLDVNPGKSDAVFRSPGEVLIFDGENFHVTDELENAREFRENALFEVE